MENLKYHSILSNYFVGQPLFFDGDLKMRPHVRKCAEQLYQQNKAEMWDEVIEALNNIDFIHSKCISGLTFDLVNDYTENLKDLPDASDETRRDSEQEKNIRKLIDESIALCKGEISTIKAIESIEVWDTNKIIKDNNRIINNPTRIDVVKTFFQFVNSESHILFKYSREPGFNFLQHAFNYTCNGPLADSVNRLVSQQIKNRSWNDPILRNRADYNPHKAQIRTLDDHKSPVEALALSYDGNILISGGGDINSDNHLRIWNPRTGILIFTLNGHETTVKSIALTPDGKSAATADDDGNIFFWNIEKRICTHKVKCYQRQIEAISISPTGHRAVSGGVGSKIQLWNVRNGKCIQKFDDLTDPINSIILTSDSKYIISAGGYARRHLGYGHKSDYCIRIWDTQAGNIIRTFEGHEDCIQAMAITTDNRKLFSADYRGQIRIWQIKTGICSNILETNFGPINSLALTSNGRYMLTSHSGNGAIQLWDIDSKLHIRTFHGHLDPVRALVLTPDGELVVSAGGTEAGYFGKGDYSIRVWNTIDGITDELKNLHLRKVHAVSITPDSNFVVSGGGDQDETKIELVGTPNLWVWDLASNSKIRELRLSYAQKILPVFNSSRILAAAERSLFVYDVLTGNELKSILAQQEGIWAAAITPDGQQAVFGCGGAVQVWDMESDKCRLTLIDKPPYGSGGVHAIALIPDGSRIISSSDGNLFVWNIFDGSCIHKCEGRDDVSSAVFTPDGRLFISAVEFTTHDPPDSFLRVWDIITGDCIKTLEGHLDGVHALAITPDGKYVVSGGGGLNRDFSVKIWEINSGKCVYSFLGHEGPIIFLNISPDGSRIVSIGTDRTIRIWDLKRGLCLNISAHNSNITAFDLKNNILVTGYLSGKVSLYDHFHTDVPLITAARLYHTSTNTWDEQPTACCEYCGQRFVIPDSVCNTISSINANSSITGFEQPPCQSLPTEVWNDPGLLTGCPYCGQKLKINPFIVDTSQWDFKISYQDKVNHKIEELPKKYHTDEELSKRKAYYQKQYVNLKLNIEKGNREKAIKEKLKEETRQKTENIEQEYKSIFEEAEKAFSEESWDKANALYSKLVHQGKFDADFLRHKIALCDLNSLTADNPEKINHITNLIKLLQDNGAGEKAKMIAEKLKERLNIIKQEELIKEKTERPWWKKPFLGSPTK